VTVAPTAWLTGKHTIFGEVVEGQGTLKELEKRGSQSGRTSERVLIERATIETE
jgi:cyclophilin family peptidyl-prolyl cis-trans isomerase